MGSAGLGTEHYGVISIVPWRLGGCPAVGAVSLTVRLVSSPARVCLGNLDK